MNDQPIITINKQRFNAIFVLVFLCAILTACIAFLASGFKAFHQHAFYYAFVVIVLLLCTILYRILFFPLKIDGITLYADRLEIIPIFPWRKKTEVFLKDITCWSEYIYNGRVPNDTKRFNYFVIHTADCTYTIAPGRGQYYDALKEGIVGGKTQIPHQEKTNASHLLAYFLSLFFILMAFGLIYLSFQKYIDDHKKIYATDITVIGGIATKAQTKFHTYRGAPTFIDIALKGYDCNFSVSGIAYYETNTISFVNNMHAGDSIYLTILTTDYRSKILTTSTDASDSRHPRYIPAYAFWDNQTKYLTLDSYNNAARPISGETVIPAMLGIFLITAAFFLTKGALKMRKSIPINTNENTVA